MPLVDGPLAANMIRYWEKELQRGARGRDSQHSSMKPRTPIIAVSKELGEDGRFECMQSGYVVLSLARDSGYLCIVFMFMFADRWTGQTLT